jgi:hypothetical protein
LEFGSAIKGCWSAVYSFYCAVTCFGLAVNAFDLSANTFGCVVYLNSDPVDEAPETIFQFVSVIYPFY